MVKVVSGMFKIVWLVGMVGAVCQSVNACTCTCMRISNVALNVTSTHCCGCVVNGSIAKTAFCVLLLLY